MSGRSDKSAAAVIVGGEPRVSLLPPEIAARKKAAATRRAAVILVFVAVLISAVGSGVGWLYQLEREGRLTAVNSETAALLQQQAKYNDIRAAAAVVQAADDARRTVAETEVDWNAFLTEVWDQLPGKTRILTLEVATATVVEVYAPPSAPLEPDRMGAMTFTVAAPSVKSVRDYALALGALPGVVDSRPYQIVRNQTLGEGTPFEGGILVTFDEQVLAHRFDGEAVDPETPTEPAVDPDTAPATPQALIESEIAYGVIAAELYATEHEGGYTGMDLAALTALGYEGTAGVTLTVIAADATHYVLTATHTSLEGTWTYDSSTGAIAGPSDDEQEEAE